MAARIRSGGRAGNTRRSSTHAIEQMPWRNIKNIDRPTEPLDGEGVQAIHKGAMHILSVIGIKMLNPEALQILKAAGCKVVGETVFMDEELVMEMVGKAPSEFTITPRNPDRQITVGGNNLVFVNVSSPPNYWDLETGKKTGDFESFRNLMKLTGYFNCIHVAGAIL